MADKKPNIATRVGAIYSLGRIAEKAAETQNREDYFRAMAVLAAYVREDSPADLKLPATADYRLRADTQAVIYVFGRRKYQMMEQPGDDLRIQLCYSNFSGGDFSGAQLVNLYLDHSDFRNADLEGAVLTKSDLEGSNLTSASLIGATLDQVNFDGAMVDGVCVQGTDLSKAQNLTQKQVDKMSGDLGTNLGGRARPADWPKQCPK